MEKLGLGLSLGLQRVWFDFGYGFWQMVCLVV